MKTILTVLFSGLFIVLNTQETVLNIKSTSSEIMGRMSNNCYHQDISQFKNFVSILNLDVFDYHDIKNQYDTDSKRKAYMESEDYKTKYSELKKLKSEMISATWYLDFEPDYYHERSSLIKYNPDNKNFSVTNELDFKLFYDEPGYIQFDQILIKCPAGITINKRNVIDACADLVEETISFKIENEFLASKIEENRTYLRLLFVFNFTGTNSIQAKKSDLTPADHYLITDIRKVVVYNSKTNEVYSTYD